MADDDKPDEDERDEELAEDEEEEDEDDEEDDEDDDDDDDKDKAPPKDEEKKKKGSGAAIGIIGFVLALGGGFYIGQYFRDKAPPVEIQEGQRYKVQLRGDEPQLGPDDALVTIIEFADYQCPYCARANEPLKDAREGFAKDARVIYKHFPLPNHKAATPAAKAAWAAHQQGKFWPMHDFLFDNKSDVEAAGAHAKTMGLDLAKYEADRTSDDAAKVVDRDMLAGGRLGVTGTPAFFVNGHRYVGLKTEDQWEQIIEAELEAAEELVKSGTARGEVYAKLMEDALEKQSAPKPAGKRREGEPDPLVNYRVPADGRPAIGPDDALVTIVEFSDFQCPYCERLAPIGHQLVETHPDVRIVFRNLPIKSHNRAREAARAALAAGKQEKFWEMHDKIFASRAKLGDIDFADLAEEIGLDVSQFKQDLEDPAIENQIAEDEQLASQFGVRSTPSSFVNGRYIRGAADVSVFNAVIEQERAKAQKLIDDGVDRSEVFAKVMEAAATEVAKGEGT